MSTQINDGGSAFPCEQHETLDGKWNQSFDPGMTLRDYFAAKAMAALVPQLEVALTADFGNAPSVIAKVRARAAHVAYEYADAMLKARAA